MSLFAAVSDAVIQYQFFVGNRLPTKQRDNREGVFDWSLGSTVASLPRAADAAYGLFIFPKDAYGPPGRTILQLLALLGPGLALQPGAPIGCAGLVCRTTGDLTWLTSHGALAAGYLVPG